MLSHAAPGRAATPLARSDGHRGAPRVHRRPAGAPCDGAGVTRSPARRAGATAVAGALLAGAALVTTAAPAQALDSTRWGGADRYATAARVSQEAFPGGADEVVVVNGARFPDALSGAPLAATRGGPLLTVEAGSVPAATREELQRLRPQVVRVVGGTSSVSDDVVRQLQQLVPTVQRVQGADRYATAAAVATTELTGAAEVVVASGESFPDALAAGAAGAALGAPLLLTARDQLPPETRAALQQLRPTRITLVGGPSVVDPRVQQQLDALAPGAVVRLFGPDRYATATTVAQDTWESAPSPLLASGEAFPDALAGAALGVPLLLSRRDCLPAATASAYGALGVRDVTGLGGTSALSDASLRAEPCR